MTYDGSAQIEVRHFYSLAKNLGKKFIPWFPLLRAAIMDTSGVGVHALDVVDTVPGLCYCLVAPDVVLVWPRRL